MTRFQRLVEALFNPIEIAPLVFFRVAFGGIMLWEVWRYFNFNRIFRYYIDPTFYFHYYGFDWLQPLPGDGMYWLFHFLGVLSIAIMLGLFYRATMVVFWLCFTYIFLLDQTQYLNHFYLISLVAFVMIFIPAHRAMSIDALLRPRLRSTTAPNWSLWLLRGQMAVVYTYGGLAKINPDWLRGEPMRDWMAARTDFPLIGPLFTDEWMVYLFSYGGLLLDLFVVPFLLWPRTRIPALMLATVFHLSNARLFNIGVFPWFAIAITLLYLPPEWFRPLRLNLRWLAPDPARLATAPDRRRLVLGGMALFFAVQMVMPLRHTLYPGYVSWTEEGHNLAWHMKLRSKGGFVTYFASDPASGATWSVDYSAMLNQRQITQMSDNPQMILRFAHYLAEQLEAEGGRNIQIRAWAMVDVNSRAPQLMIDPTADLAREPYDLSVSDWILPLVQMPAPAETNPAVLVSRRAPGLLVIVNLTEDPFPLDQLTFEADGQRLSGADFGLEALWARECVVAHSPGLDLGTVFLTCNEAGSRLVIDEVFWGQPLNIALDDQNARACAEPVCTIAVTPFVEHDYFDLSRYLPALISPGGW
jgi:vitamin K-dependent gamma-carboxylase